MTTTTSFHLFPDLPGEIRLKIWGELLQVSRTVELNCKKGQYPGSKRYAEAFSTKDAVPSLLHVNQEARYEALKIYTPEFATQTSTKRTYFAFDRDILKVPEGVLAYLGHPELQRIVRMSMEVKDHSYFGHFNMDTIRQMPNLKELDLFSGHGIMYSWDRARNPYVEVLQREFEEVKIEDPGWECPRVRIFSKSTGQEMASIEAGALEPELPREIVMSSSSSGLAQI
ncbi:hypothetical protein PVAG01_04285 [Phlyctema vagabunda]|uniref:2EXR domain-containing protein n=1 Tax=Phlyctema vagabunda TaxID=108571 RepID=A0ABR4PNX3_9HELO